MESSVPNPQSLTGHCFEIKRDSEIDLTVFNIYEHPPLTHRFLSGKDSLSSTDQGLARANCPEREGRRGEGGAHSANIRVRQRHLLLLPVVELDAELALRLQAATTHTDMFGSGIFGQEYSLMRNLPSACEPAWQVY